MANYRNYLQREREGGRLRLIREALAMHEYYEEKYYTLIMVTYDDDERHNKLLDEIKKKSEYWRDVYVSLVFG